MTTELGAAIEELSERAFGPITKTDIVRYQGASGDFHPLHHDEDFARAAGFHGVFAVGMMHAGYLASYVVERFGAENVRRFRVRFREQVWPGDTLTCSGRVVAGSPLPDGRESLTVELQVRRQTGGVAAEGLAEVLRAG
jgi:acyl dehydratase